VSISAIPTNYAGCRFRSRLEARWAVFFDAMGIGWEYEKQGYRIGRRNYLPDFYLPLTRTWAEVKGSPQGLDRNLLYSAAHELPGGTPRLMVLGPIPEAGQWAVLAWQALTPGPGARGAGLADTRVTWKQRAVLTLQGPVLSGAPDDHPDEWLRPVVLHGRTGIAAARQRAAYTAARGARFEHGESGAARGTDLQPW
jgi:hypothetical protein